MHVPSLKPGAWANCQVMTKVHTPRGLVWFQLRFFFAKNAAVIKAANTLTGSGGPSGANSDLWKHILLSKKLSPSSTELAQAIATFAVKIATEPIDPKHITSYVASRLVPLSKKPTGIRPIGIGEILRRLVDASNECDGMTHETMKSAEGTTQGDTAAMPMYACCLMPLIRSLKDSSLTQIFYADDGLGGGKLSSVKSWWDKIKSDGPGYGYLPNPGKSWLIVKPQYEDTAREMFTDVNITTDGQRYLGSYIGTEESQREFVEEFVQNEVAKWNEEINQLCEIAVNEPQLAYSAYTIGISKRWSYLMRTTPGISDQLASLSPLCVTIVAVCFSPFRCVFSLFCQLSVCIITNFDCFASCHMFPRGIYIQ
eukprot:sb/3465857/